MKVIKVILISCFLFFLNCKSPNNCILNMKFERELDGPGPDLLTFQIVSEKQELEGISEKIELIEIGFDQKKVLKSSVFSLSKKDNGNYELKLSSPYFTLSGYNDDEDVYKLYNESKMMEIKLILKEDKTIRFIKCN